MPDLPREMVENLQALLVRYLERANRTCQTSFIASGGSAAVFKSESELGIRAIKVYDPKFFAEGRCEAERRRLRLQQGLIGHECDSLISIIAIEEFEGTALVEMEFIDWPSLKKVIHMIPDDKIESLFSQLVLAVLFLDKKGVIHRDIKPENIHVSEDFSKLKLLDLGVIREYFLDDEEGTSATDHGLIRPFIATAQYSSPEYLFRLDPPSPELWKGLSIYQMGAVLHDLIMKRPLFGDIVELQNRWLLTRAVLETVPSLDDTRPDRLLRLKSLASRSLTKDIKLRLKLVDWCDFEDRITESPSTRLKMRMSRMRSGFGTRDSECSDPQLNLARQSLISRTRGKVRDELIQLLENGIGIEAPYDSSSNSDHFEINIKLFDKLNLYVRIDFKWDEVNIRRNAQVLFLADIFKNSSGYIYDDTTEGELISVVNCDGGSFDGLVLDIVDYISLTIEHALDLNDAGMAVESPVRIVLSKLANDRRDQ